jgi:hypothetical protein
MRPVHLDLFFHGFSDKKRLESDKSCLEFLESNIQQKLRTKMTFIKLEKTDCECMFQNSRVHKGASGRTRTLYKVPCVTFDLELNIIGNRLLNRI